MAPAPSSPRPQLPLPAATRPRSLTNCGRLAGYCGPPSGRRRLIVGSVDDELIAANQELLRHGLPGKVPRELSGEHRLIPLAADINGDVAVTVFARRLQWGRLAGMPGIEKSQFQRRDGTWAYLGGGSGGPFDGYPLSERPPAASQHGYLRPLGRGQVCLKRTRRIPWPARYAFHATLRASAEVHQLQAGTRVLAVPFHGYAVLTWANRRGPTVIAIARDGTRLASMDLSRDPLKARHRRLPPARRPPQ